MKSTNSNLSISTNSSSKTNGSLSSVPIHSYTLIDWFHDFNINSKNYLKAQNTADVKLWNNLVDKWTNNHHIRQITYEGCFSILNGLAEKLKSSSIASTSSTVSTLSHNFNSFQNGANNLSENDISNALMASQILHIISKFSIVDLDKIQLSSTSSPISYPLSINPINIITNLLHIIAIFEQRQPIYPMLKSIISQLCLTISSLIVQNLIYDTLPYLGTFQNNISLAYQPRYDCIKVINSGLKKLLQLIFSFTIIKESTKVSIITYIPEHVHIKDIKAGLLPLFSSIPTPPTLNNSKSSHGGSHTYEPPSHLAEHLLIMFSFSFEIVLDMIFSNFKGILENSLFPFISYLFNKSFSTTILNDSKINDSVELIEILLNCIKEWVKIPMNLPVPHINSIQSKSFLNPTINSNSNTSIKTTYFSQLNIQQQDILLCYQQLLHTYIYLILKQFNLYHLIIYLVQQLLTLNVQGNEFNQSYSILFKDIFYQESLVLVQNQSNTFHNFFIIKNLSQFLPNFLTCINEFLVNFSELFELRILTFNFCKVFSPTIVLNSSLSSSLTVPISSSISSSFLHYNFNSMWEDLKINIIKYIDLFSIVNIHLFTFHANILKSNSLYLLNKDEIIETFETLTSFFHLVSESLYPMISSILIINHFNNSNSSNPLSNLNHDNIKNVSKNIVLNTELIFLIKEILSIFNKKYFLINQLYDESRDISYKSLLELKKLHLNPTLNSNLNSLNILKNYSYYLFNFINDIYPASFTPITILLFRFPLQSNIDDEEKTKEERDRARENEKNLTDLRDSIIKLLINTTMYYDTIDYSLNFVSDEVSLTNATIPNTSTTAGGISSNNESTVFVDLLAEYRRNIRDFFRDINNNYYLNFLTSLINVSNQNLKKYIDAVTSNINQLKSSSSQNIPSNPNISFSDSNFNQIQTNSLDNFINISNNIFSIPWANMEAYLHALSAICKESLAIILNRQNSLVKKDADEKAETSLSNITNKEDLLSYLLLLNYLYPSLLSLLELLAHPVALNSRIIQRIGVVIVFDIVNFILSSIDFFYEYIELLLNCLDTDSMIGAEMYRYSTLFNISPLINIVSPSLFSLSSLQNLFKHIFSFSSIILLTSLNHYEDSIPLSSSYQSIINKLLGYKHSFSSHSLPHHSPLYISIDNEYWVLTRVGEFLPFRVKQDHIGAVSINKFITLFLNLNNLLTFNSIKFVKKKIFLDKNFLNNLLFSNTFLETDSVPLFLLFSENAIKYTEHNKILMNNNNIFLNNNIAMIINEYKLNQPYYHSILKNFKSYNYNNGLFKGLFIICTRYLFQLNSFKIYYKSNDQYLDYLITLPISPSSNTMIFSSSPSLNMTQKSMGIVFRSFFSLLCQQYVESFFSFRTEEIQVTPGTCCSILWPILGPIMLTLISSLINNIKDQVKNNKIDINKLNSVLNVNLNLYHETDEILTKLNKMSYDIENNILSLTQTFLPPINTSTPINFKPALQLICTLLLYQCPRDMLLAIFTETVDTISNNLFTSSNNLMNLIESNINFINQGILNNFQLNSSIENDRKFNQIHKFAHPYILLSSSHSLLTIIMHPIIISYVFNEEELDFVCTLSSSASFLSISIILAQYILANSSSFLLYSTYSNESIVSLNLIYNILHDGISLNINHLLPFSVKCKAYFLSLSDYNSIVESISSLLKCITKVDHLISQSKNKIMSLNNPLTNLNIFKSLDFDISKDNMINFLIKEFVLIFQQVSNVGITAVNIELSIKNNKSIVIKSQKTSYFSLERESKRLIQSSNEKANLLSLFLLLQFWIQSLKLTSLVAESSSTLPQANSFELININILGNDSISSIVKILHSSIHNQPIVYSHIANTNISYEGTWPTVVWRQVLELITIITGPIKVLSHNNNLKIISINELTDAPHHTNKLNANASNGVIYMANSFSLEQNTNEYINYLIVSNLSNLIMKTLFLMYTRCPTTLRENIIKTICSTTMIFGTNLLKDILLDFFYNPQNFFLSSHPNFSTNKLNIQQVETKISPILSAALSGNWKKFKLSIKNLFK